MVLIKNIFNFIINIFYPPLCIFCESTLEVNVRRRVCGECMKRLLFCKNKPCCVKCGKPLTSFGKKQMCTFCLETKNKYFSRIISVFEYSGEVRDAILRYKLTRMRDYARTFSDFMYQLFKDEYSQIDFDLICCAPSHKNHGSGHGFDHSAELGKGLAELTGIKYQKGLLYKNRKTPRQSSLKYHKRLKNLSGAVSVGEKVSVEGKVILLVDDIITTRATVTECARALRSKGARAVFVISAATTVRG